MPQTGSFTLAAFVVMMALMGRWRGSDMRSFPFWVVARLDIVRGILGMLAMVWG